GNRMALGKIAHGPGHGRLEPLECRREVIADRDVDVRCRNRRKRVEPGAGRAWGRGRQFLRAARPARERQADEQQRPRRWAEPGATQRAASPGRERKRRHQAGHSSRILMISPPNLLVANGVSPRWATALQWA